IAYLACCTSSWGTSAWRAFVSSARNCSSIFWRSISASPGSLERLSCSAKASRSPQRSARAGAAAAGVSGMLFLHSHQFELQVLELRRNIEGDGPGLLDRLPVLAHLVDLEVLPARLHRDLRRGRRHVPQRQALQGGRDELVHAVARADLRFERHFLDDLLLGHLRHHRQVELAVEQAVIPQLSLEERV